ncbi:hypothetical protein ZYGR_0AD00660 [Zygosaccharomyces rouxii]|uniref:Major facilitator superfamily (MFS) profile domain-containing protein n=1 Tax=Zygosaccharomyces rouxii TaxID=4956 RepID=A0A1Q3A5H3_ZYGRO|nr:hypothetical protein ZYGR_0AD00660 [Zygosaccharomyces rouxii]
MENRSNSKISEPRFERQEVHVTDKEYNDVPPEFENVKYGQNAHQEVMPVDSDGEKQKLRPSLNMHGLPDKLHVSKWLVIRQSELLAAEYNWWPFRILLLFCAFICGYGYGLDSNIRFIYTSYVTNSFSEHSLLSTVNVINAVISAASQIVYARLADVFGRLTLFITAVVFYSMGTVIQSQSYNIETYAAGSIFYNLGYVGVVLVLLLILSDFSSLKWRLFYQFAPTWPFIINNWISGNITSRANPQENWSWDIGMWAFIFPLSCVPLICCMLHMWWKARRTEEWKILNEEKTYFKTHGLVSFIKELFWKLDTIGTFIMTVSLGCILVPLTLAGGTSSKWDDSQIIGPLVLGVVLLPMLIVYELKWAREPILPWKLIKDRAVWASMSISFLYDFIFYMAYDYLYTVMIVAVDESVKSATRISSLSAFVSTVFSPFFALYITRVTRLKPYIIAGCGLWMVAMGLLYHFRGGKSSHSGIIGGLCVWGVGTTMFTYPVNVSVQSATSHENMATVTSLNYTLYRIGSAVGIAVSGCIWTQNLYHEIFKRVKDAKIASYAYEQPYNFIAEYTWGTPIRQQVVEAYMHVQKLETLVGLVFCAPLLLFSLCLRDPELTDEIAHNDLGEGEYIARDKDYIFDWIEDKCRKFVPGLHPKGRHPSFASQEAQEETRSIEEGQVPDDSSDVVMESGESNFKKLQGEFHSRRVSSREQNI